MQKGFIVPKDDVKPPVLPGAALGHPMQLSFEGIGTFKSQLIGMEYGSCLIVKLPPVTDIVTKLYQKNHIVVRYLHGGNVYGFRSTLIGIIKEPLRLFILAYPDVIDSLNVRKNERYSCLISASVRTSATDPIEWELYGFITDISAGGCKFECSLSDSIDRPSLKAGQSVELSFQFPDEEVWRKLQTEIRMLNMDTIKLTIGLRYAPDETQEDQQQIVNDIQTFISSLRE